MKTVMFALAFSALAVTGALAQTDMTEAERDSLHSEIRAYLLENPEVLREAMAVLEEREADEQVAEDQRIVEENIDALYADGFSYTLGDADSPLTIVEFIDYQCGYCKRAHPDVQALLESNPDIRYIIKELPILGPESLVAARSTMAVLENQGPETYATFSDALMRHQGKLTTAVIASIAEESGVNIDEMIALADSDLITERLNATRVLAKAVKLSGTPTFVIGDVILRGYLPKEDMAELIEDVREGT
ncbi:DsbA family protein [Algicella marina]|nr:DsbA family protein [Algicella marina]